MQNMHRKIIYVALYSFSICQGILNISFCLILFIKLYLYYIKYIYKCTVRKKTCNIGQYKVLMNKLRPVLSVKSRLWLLLWMITATVSRKLLIAGSGARATAPVWSIQRSASLVCLYISSLTILTALHIIHSWLWVQQYSTVLKHQVVRLRTKSDVWQITILQRSDLSSWIKFQSFIIELENIGILKLIVRFYFVINIPQENVGHNFLA